MELDQRHSRHGSINEANDPPVEIATVAEDRPPYPEDLRWLFASLRRHGGTLSGAPATVHVVGPGVDPITAAVRPYGVDVQRARRFDGRCPHANKLAMLGEVQSDYLVALDTDILVARDFSRHVVGESVGAKVANHCPISLEHWRAIFEELRLPFPNARAFTGCDWQETLPYFNSGVLIVPRALATPLRDAWAFSVRKLLDCMAHLPPRVQEQKFFTDQLALTVALFVDAIPYRELPVSMNFSCANRLDNALDPDGIRPYLIHHHHALHEGIHHAALAAEVSRLRDETNSILQL